MELLTKIMENLDICREKPKIFWTGNWMYINDTEGNQIIEDASLFEAWKFSAIFKCAFDFDTTDQEYEELEREIINGGYDMPVTFTKKRRKGDEKSIETAFDLMKGILNTLDKDDEEIWIKTEDTQFYKRPLNITKDEYGININCIDAEKWLGVE